MLSTNSFTAATIVPVGREFASSRPDLFGINGWLDEALFTLGELTEFNRQFHQAAQGDDSIALPREVGDACIELFAECTSTWWPIASLHEMARLRDDGRTDYHAHGVNSSQLFTLLKRLAGRVLLITATGGLLPLIKETSFTGRGGKYLTLIEVSPNGDAIRLLYGNRQYGTLPSSETIMHMIAAATMAEKCESSSMIHCHPMNLVKLALHPRVARDWGRLNALLISSVQSSLSSYGGATIALMPYYDPGSKALALANLEMMPVAKFALWGNHGTYAIAATPTLGT